MSAYRIVQEALTNARRYGRGPLALRSSRVSGEVRIRRANAVGAARTAAADWGCCGMAERASVLGGTLTHGVRDGRFELEAILPCRGGAVSGPTVLVADDQDLVRSGLELVVEARGCDGASARPPTVARR